MFFQVLKDPILFSWATEQISKDWDDKQALIKNVIEALLPWINPEMYSIVEKKKQSKERKLTTLANVNNKDEVDQVNAFDKFMKNMGIKKEDLNG